MTGVLTVGVDVGGTRIKAGLVDDRGAILAEAVRDTPARTVQPGVVEDAVVGAVEELLGREEGQAAGVGIGAAGFVDAERGVVVFAPHLPWRDHPLRDRLAGRLDLPVVVDNDANAAGWAEHRFGSGQGESHLAVITLGTGIGGAIITDGRLQRGRHGLAGEFGHQQMVPEGRPCECGHRGCWEQYVSGSVVRRAGQELVRTGGGSAQALREMCGGDPDRLTGEQVTRAARAGDPASVGVLTEVGERLGEGLAGVVAALDPGTVVVGGGLSEAGELLLGPARAALSRRLVGGRHRAVPDVVAARLGAWAGLVGAADLARTSTDGGGG